MNRQEKYNFIKNWLLENNLYYPIDPRNEEDIEDYVFALGSKMEDFYKALREKDIIPQNSYQALIELIQEKLVVEAHFALRS